MRPGPTLLDGDLIAKVVAEARGLLCTLGVEIHNKGVVAMLCDHGAGLLFTLAVVALPFL